MQSDRRDMLMAPTHIQAFSTQGEAVQGEDCATAGHLGVPMCQMSVPMSVN